MTLPPLDPSEPFLALRLEAMTELGNGQVNKGVFYTFCAACGFSGWDGTFTAWPDLAFETPDDLRGFAAAECARQMVRKCPHCHGPATLEGFRLLAMAGSLGKDLVVTRDVAAGTTEFSLLPPKGPIETLDPGAPQLTEACLDSCLRAGLFMIEVDPSRAETARRLLELVAAARRKDPEAAIALARLAFQRGDDKGAQRYVEAARARAHRTASNAMSLGGLLGEMALARSNMDWLNAAIGAYERGIKLSGGDLQAHLALGRLLVQSGNFGPAAFHLERARRSTSTAVEAMYLLGVAALHEGRGEDAVVLFRDLVRENGGDSSVLHMYAWALAKLGRREEAEAILKRAAAIELDPAETDYFRKLVDEELARA
jgi:Flp pilus assembly protein TadD